MHHFFNLTGEISQDLLKQTATHTVSDENRRLDPGGIYYSAALAAMFHGARTGDNNCTICTICVASVCQPYLSVQFKYLEKQMDL